MASNLLYSPVPAYPAAASASHVQGEVKLSADVDRDGKVASVRVISGPPLLRDAALDAVQRWRYRPYLSSGGPIPMAAIAVMDFQLP
jgi:TonB family protein